MAILKLAPAYKDYLWGGTRLIDKYSKQPDRVPLAESWEVSCHPDGPSTIASGAREGQTLLSYVEEKGVSALGANCEDLPEFPLLVKLIDAKQTLSVQVHPNDAYAFAHEGQQGKTEMWYVIDCEKDAYLYIGFAREVTRQEVAQAIQDETLPGLLQRVPVKPGDCFLIEAGTVHAIGAGILLAEVQQSSNITYRLYDYGRKDARGNTRALHIERALEVMTYTKAPPQPFARYHLQNTDYFTVDKATVIGQIEGVTANDSFTALLLYRGAGILYNARQAFTFGQAASFFIEAGTGAWSIIGNCACLAVRVPASLKKRLNRYRQPSALM